MKKLTVFAFLFALVAGLAGAQTINLGSFPLGKWVDKNYDALWEFSSDNIRILSLDGKELFNFSQKGITEFSVSASLKGPAITFTCNAAGRKYTITKPVSNANLVLEIVREGQAKYTVEMTPQ